MDAYTPFPVEGLAEALGFSDRRVPLLTLAGGIFGAALGYGMQVYTNLAFPINIGNRPLISTPAFMLITFELMVLFAVLAAIFGMFGAQSPAAPQSSCVRRKSVPSGDLGQILPHHLRRR